MEKFRITARWLSRPMTLGKSAELIKTYMKGLQDIHPIFRFWMNLGEKNFENVSPDLSDIGHHVFKKYVSSTDNSQNSFFADKNTLDSSGFTNYFFTPDAESEDQIRSTEKGGVELAFHGIGADSFYLPSSVSLSLPTDAYGELHTPEMVRKLLEWTIKVWQPTCGYAISHDFVKACQGGGEFRIRELYACWMTYVKFPPLLNCLPASLPCKHEVMPDDASLFTLCNERPSRENHDHLDRARCLQDIFENLYLCDSKCVLYGWPRDSLETEYKMQISQAPAAVSYVVKMAYFDGYDAKRDVLIYATLLRAIDRVSLDLDNYDRKKFPNRSYNINTNPYVIEARRQISAVDMSGHSTPIEWHIGLEENIVHLQSILTMANIDKSRLSIQYTPFLGEITEAENDSNN